MSRFSIIVSVSLLIIASSFADASKPPYAHLENVVYHQAHGVALVADIFKPGTKPNGHAIVVVASGAWSSDRGKIRDLDRAGLFEELCNRGFHVFAIRPGSISRFSAHDMKDHVEAGIRWVKAHAGEYAIDADSLGLFGASAGGHLASLVAVSGSSADSSVDATVSAVGVFFPPTDFLNFGGKALDPRKAGRFDRILERLAFRDRKGVLSDQEVHEGAIAISPAHLVSLQTPPFLLIHGDADPLVPLQQSQQLVSALKKTGVSAELIIKEGGAHPWPTIREEIVVMANWFQIRLIDEPVAP